MQVINAFNGQAFFPPVGLRNISAMRVLSDGSAVLAADDQGALVRWELDTGKLSAQTKLAVTEPITERVSEVRLLGGTARRSFGDRSQPERKCRNGG